MSPAAYLALMRAARDLADLPRGDLRRAELDYRRSVGADTSLVVAIDVSRRDREDTGWTERYRMFADGTVVTDVLAWWDTGPAPTSLSRATLDGDPEALAFETVVRTRGGDYGPDGAVRPQAILQWLDDAVVHAASESGWAGSGLDVAPPSCVVVAHRLDIGPRVGEGTRLTIRSRLAQLRVASTMWTHEIVDASGRRVALDVARGGYRADEDRTFMADPGAGKRSSEAPDHGAPSLRLASTVSEVDPIRDAFDAPGG